MMNTKPSLVPLLHRTGRRTWSIFSLRTSPDMEVLGPSIGCLDRYDVRIEV